MKYKIVIPSYKRHDTIQGKTLKFLEGHGIDPKLIRIFVNDEDPNEYNKYEEALSTNEYAKGIEIVKGVATLGLQRNFIERYYPEGTNLMMFDDDIEQVLAKSGKKLVTVSDLEEDVILRGFRACHKHGAKLFGIYAASNPFFMKHRTYTKLSYIVGCMFGVVVEHDPFLERVTNHGEDYEYVLRQYHKNRVVIRLDDITAKTIYYDEKGGLQEVRTAEYIHDSIKKIAEMFPQYCTMYIRKTTGNAELRLRDKTKNAGTLKVGPGDDVQSIIEAMKKSNTERER
jgi:hypothetical protein